MVRVPKWEPLSGALARVVASGVPEDEAKSNISGAIAEREVHTRLTVLLETDVFVKWRQSMDIARGLGSGSKWKRLCDALARLTAIGIDKAQAKRSICRAIADRRIKIRFRVGREESMGSVGEPVAGTLRSGDEVEIPTDLDPEDLDWQHSHPLKPWRDARQPLAGLWHIEWIELLIENGDEAVDYFEGANVKVPPHLTPADFDWENSRPLKPWQVRPRGGRQDVWRSFSLPAVLLELSVSEIRNMLCVGEQADNKAEPPTTNVGQESTAIRALASSLRTNNGMTRADAEKWCKEAGYNLGKRAFARVWPEARDRAGLPRIAAPGRKRKSSRGNRPA